MNWAPRVGVSGEGGHYCVVYGKDDVGSVAVCDSWTRRCCIFFVPVGPAKELKMFNVLVRSFR